MGARLFTALKTAAGVSLLAGGLGLLGALGVGSAASVTAGATSPAFLIGCRTVPFLTKLTLKTTTIDGTLTPSPVVGGGTATMTGLMMHVVVRKSAVGPAANSTLTVNVHMGGTVTGGTPTSDAIDFKATVNVPTNVTTTVPATGLPVTAPGTLASPTLTADGSGTLSLGADASTVTDVTKTGKKVATVAKSTTTMRIELGTTTLGTFACSSPAETIATDSITKSGPLAITTTSLPSGKVGVAYTTTLTASGGTGIYTWTVTGLPAGLTSAATGKVSGKPSPSTVGDYTLHVTVTDHAGTKVTASLKLAIYTTPAITTTTLPSGTVGVAYTTTLTASGGTGSYTWTATGLPAGLTLAATGKITGTPTAKGSSAVHLKVTDGAHAAATATLTLTIAPPIVLTGYRLVGADGGVFDFGNATYHGSLPGDGISVHDVVGIVATPTGGGYWLVGSDGGVFAFGDAAYHGSVPADGVSVDDVVGIAATPTGGGYRLESSEGGVFDFGNATYYGSVAGVYGDSVDDIVGIVAGPTGGGYRLAGSDGGVFDFGNATYYGSVPGDGVSVHDVAGIVAGPTGGGYRLVGSAGGVFDFGNASYQGSLPGDGISVRDIVGIAAS
jgi:hypothetical protein